MDFLQAECDQREKWYSTQYSLGPIPEDWLALWREGGAEHAEALHLPRPNPFIPTQFDMIQVGWQRGGVVMLISVVVLVTVWAVHWPHLQVLLL